MVRLVLINGAPASGKSTLARRYADDHPLVLALDIDVILGMLGRWLDDPYASGLAARRMAIEMARTHLTSGHDVVVPQFLGRVEFVLELERLCADVGARFVEVALLGDPDVLLQRFERRSAAAATATDRDASVLLARGGGVTVIPELCARLAEVIARRPGTIPLTSGDIDGAYRSLVECLQWT